MVDVGGKKERGQIMETEHTYRKFLKIYLTRIIIMVHFQKYLESACIKLQISRKDWASAKACKFSHLHSS